MSGWELLVMGRKVLRVQQVGAAGVGDTPQGTACVEGRLGR